jgi:hypothetical protein
MNVDSAPGRPQAPADVQAHVERVKTAIEQLERGQPVEMADLPEPRFDPEEMRWAQAEKRAAAARDAGRARAQGRGHPRDEDRGAGPRGAERVRSASRQAWAELNLLLLAVPVDRGKRLAPRARIRCAWKPSGSWPSSPIAPSASARRQRRAHHEDPQAVSRGGDGRIEAPAGRGRPLRGGRLLPPGEELMAGIQDCIARLSAAAGRALTDDEVARSSSASTRRRATSRPGACEGGETNLGGRSPKKLGTDAALTEDLVTAAARQAAAQLQREAELAARQADLQLVRLGARQADVDRLQADGFKPMDAPEKVLARDYSGRTNVESLEQKADRLPGLLQPQADGHLERARRRLPRLLPGPHEAAQPHPRAARRGHGRPARQARRAGLPPGGRGGAPGLQRERRRHRQARRLGHAAAPQPGARGGRRQGRVDRPDPAAPRSQSATSTTPACAGATPRCASSSARPGTRSPRTATRTPSPAASRAPASARTATPRAGRSTSRTPRASSATGRPSASARRSRSSWATSRRWRATSPSSSTSARTRTSPGRRSSTRR